MDGLEASIQINVWQIINEFPAVRDSGGGYVSVIHGNSGVPVQSF